MKRSTLLAGACTLALIAAAALALDPSVVAVLTAALADPHVQTGVLASGGIALDAETFKAELKKVSENIDGFFAKRKEKEGEIMARLREVEQKLDRRGGVPGAGWANASGAVSGGALGALSDAAQGIIDGLKGSTSARLHLPMSIRASLSSDAPGAGGSEQMTIPTQNLGVVSTYPVVARLLQLLPSRPVTGNSATYTRIRFATGSPAGNQAAKVAELALKPESQVETEPVLIELPTWAHHFKVSKQVLDDVAELRAILDDLLRNGLLDKVDAGIYADLTTVGNFTAFTPAGSEPVGDGIARIAAQVVNAGGGSVVVAVNPSDYLDMQLQKASTSGVYLGTPASLAAKVVAVPVVAEGKLLAFSPGDGASWLDREGINITVGIVDDDFIRNAVRLLGELRGATAVRNPALVAYGNTV